MTGFAQASAESARRRFEVVIQGWNHRHLDLVVRAPEELRARERDLRERVAATILRGRCEVAVRVAALGERRLTLHVERDALRALRAGARELEREGLLDGSTLGLGDLLRTPQLFALEADAESWGADEQSALDAALSGALTAFEAARAAEGERLAVALERARATLGGLVDRLDARRREVAEGLESALRARLDELLPGGVAALPPERLAQEVVMLVDRSDVQEELDRLRAHLDHLGDVLRAPGAIGKRLEFLAQEVLRELNTLGAKCRDQELARLVVDAKVVCEQLREQIQNVE
jgi:uncharacterized protein (TIGR00255 family)